MNVQNIRLTDILPPRDTYFDEIIKWHQKRNGVNGLKKEYIGYENGVLGGILSGTAVPGGTRGCGPFAQPDIYWLYRQSEEQWL